MSIPEIATRLTIWIGQLQWMTRKNYHGSSRPILSKLDQISCRDALLNEDGTEAEWPAAECIVGNPPFLGDKKMISEMGEEYVTALRNRYDGRVPGGADLVTYWFAKARQAIENGKTQRAGLVCTNSIRGGKNRKVLDDICESTRIFEAWSDEDWVLDGAAVRVSIVCFSSGPLATKVHLDGKPVVRIHADLTAEAHDFTSAKSLSENRGVCFQGIKKVGAFNIPGDIARTWLQLPSNPNGTNNREVLRPYYNGLAVTRRPSDTWIIDFGCSRALEDAAMYEAPFQHVLSNVKQIRVSNREGRATKAWWLHQRSRPAMRRALEGLYRYLATPEVSKHRVFVWLPIEILPDGTLFAIARQDDFTFGLLHSRFHEVWSLRKGTSLEDRPRYTPTSTFETFPFPEGLSPNIPPADYASDPRAIAITEAARNLNQLRECWLNPPELVKREPEVVPDFPERLIPVGTSAAAQLKKRTLTNLYNENPTWLQQAHRRLDEAVADAYGWSADISDDEALRNLLELNLSRAADASSLLESEKDAGGHDTEDDNSGH